mgnify:CR=1 FL=1|nr:MAG TPA: DNA-binding response regulator [Caudoviricetes sp.]
MKKWIYFGAPNNISDLKKPSLKITPIERNDIKIGVVDNEPFEKMEILRQHQFNIQECGNISSIDSLLAFDIILCDIQGVGLKFNKTFQGAYLIKEIYKKYPFKVIIVYSGKLFDARYNDYLKYAEFSIKKDASSEEWVDKLDKALELINNPENRWIRLRDYLLSRGVSLFDLTLLEDDYVTRIIERKSFDDFPKDKIRHKLKPDFKDVLKSFATNIATKFIVG